MTEMTRPNRAQASLFRRDAADAARLLRPTTKVLPEHVRDHNRALVLQTLLSVGQQSRADVARSTGLTRVTVSELVAELMDQGLVVETGQSEGPRAGKPAILLDIDRNSFHIIGLDLSDLAVFRGAVLDLGGTILQRIDVPFLPGTGQSAVDQAIALTEELLSLVSAPLLGIGVGSPGVVDLGGVVVNAPNLEWIDLPLQALLSDRFGVAVIVANDANAAVLAEHSFGDALGDVMLVRIGLGVGAGLLVGGGVVSGRRFAAGEIGHVVVGDDGGERCTCGKTGCLETWIALPRLDAKLADVDSGTTREDILRGAGMRLGTALAPIVGALDLGEVVLSGPEALLSGAFIESTLQTVRSRTMTTPVGEFAVRLTTLGHDIVLRGAAVMVISARLGVS